MFKIILFSLLAFQVSAANLVDGIVAVVNEEIITKSDLKSYKRKLKNSALQEDLFNVDYKKVLTSDKKLIDHLIDVKITESEIKKNGISVSMEKVQAEISKIRMTAFRGISEKEFSRFLKSKSLSMADYQDFMKKRLERQDLIRKMITSKIRISEEDIKAYYVQKYNSKNNSYQYSLAHMIFLTKEGSTTEETLARANDVYRKLQNGKSFESLASQFSEDPNFSNGGFLGKFKSGELHPQMEKAVINVNKGAFSKVVKISNRVHIFKVLEKTIVDSPDYLQKKPMITEMLYDQALKKQFRFWLTQKRKEAFIRIN